MDQFTEMAQRFTQMWADFAGKMMTSGMGMMNPAMMFGATPPTTAARETRDNMLGAMSSWFNQFLRTPEFLDMMKRSMDTSMAVREQVNDMATRMLHNVGAAAKQDTDAVMQSIRHMEQRVLDRIEDLADRVEDLRRRLDDAEGEQNGEARRSRRNSRGASVR